MSLNELICLSNMVTENKRLVEALADKCDWLRRTEKSTVYKNSRLDLSSRVRRGNINAVLINDNIPQKDRLLRLNKIAIQQMTILVDVQGRKLLK